jgi:hypothetical protein
LRAPSEVDGTGLSLAGWNQKARGHHVPRAQF